MSNRPRELGACHQRQSVSEVLSRTDGASVGFCHELIHAALAATSGNIGRERREVLIQFLVNLQRP